MILFLIAIGVKDIDAKMKYLHACRALAFISFSTISIHSIICSIIGIDAFYLAHLTIIVIIYVSLSILKIVYASEESIADCSGLIVSMAVFAFWGIPTRILYLNTFRISVERGQQDPYHLFRLLGILWATLFVVPLSSAILRIFFPSKTYLKHLAYAVQAFFEIEMYLALVEDTYTFAYWISCELTHTECFYMLNISVECVLELLSFTHIGCPIVSILISHSFRIFRWIFLWYYAKEKLLSLSVELWEGWDHLPDSLEIHFNQAWERRFRNCAASVQVGLGSMENVCLRDIFLQEEIPRLEKAFPRPNARNEDGSKSEDSFGWTPTHI